MSIQEKNMVLIFGLIALAIIPAVFNVPYATAIYQSIYDWVMANGAFMIYLFALMVYGAGYILDLPYTDVVRTLGGVIVFVLAILVMPAIVNVPYVTGWYQAGGGWIVGGFTSLGTWLKLKR